MSKHYTAALIEQIKAVENWHLYGDEHAEQMRLLRMTQFGNAPSREDVIHGALNLLETSDPFFLEAPIQQLLVDSLETVPTDLPIGEIGFPFERGWLVFANAIALPQVAQELGFLTWTGFAWCASDVMRNKDGGEPYPIVCIEYYGKTATGKEPICMSTQLWPYIDPAGGWKASTVARIQDVERGVKVQEMTDFQHKLVFAILSWLTQTVSLVVESHPPRQQRRYILQHRGYEPFIRRITLRQAKKSRHADGSKDMNWSCRWLVRSHWRNQYYPASKAHKPLWVQRYVKGPEDKPLKRPSIALFDISR